MLKINGTRQYLRPHIPVLRCLSHSLPFEIINFLRLVHFEHLAVYAHELNDQILYHCISIIFVILFLLLLCIILLRIRIQSNKERNDAYTPERKPLSPKAQLNKIDILFLNSN
jgi:hypothetical protein